MESALQMSAGLRKGRNRLSLMLSLGTQGKTGDPHSPNFRGSSQQTSSVTSTSTLDTMSTTHLPVSSPHKASSPSNPMLSSPLPLSPAIIPPLPLPATVNEFDAHEKTRLLKQARKLSQIFGEMLTMNEADERQSPRHSREESRSGRMPGRSASVASSGNKLQRPPNRVRSRPTLRGSPASPPMPSRANVLVTPPASATQLTGSTLTPSTSRSTLKSANTPAKKEPLQRKSLNVQSSPATRTKQPIVLPVDPASPSATQVLTQGNTAQLARSNSTRSTTNRTRGRSMDCARSEVPLLVGSAAQASRNLNTKRPATASGNEATLRRSRSMWEKKGKLGAGGGAAKQEEDKLERDAVIRDLKENSKFGDMPKLTRMQRSQSVRRARKLNHMFGSEPPQALYQFSAFVDKRLSDATIYSVSSSADLLSVQNPSSRAAKHRSISSVASTISEPASPVAPMHDIPATKGHRRTPSTPAAPFADTAANDAFDEEDDHPELFRQRRLRAAKLSRFFGVDPHDISHSLTAAPPMPSNSRPTGRDAALPYFGRSGSAPRKGVEPQPSPAGVDVHIQKSSGKFWSRNDERREVDMANVINRLREMR